MRHAVPMVLLLTCACSPALAGQLHNAHPMQPISAKWSPPRNATLQPVRIAGPRNGVYSGMVIYTGRLKAPADISDLTGEQGTVPAQAITIRYASRQHDLGGGKRAREGKRDTFDALSPHPDPTAELQPILITVHIPANTRPGEYTGTLTAAGRKAKVELTVADYLLPDPNQWAIWCSMQQSPASIAVRYGVQPYSDRFFELLESSFRLMGQLGNNVLHIPVIGKNMHGDEHGVIHFRRKDNKLIPDFTALKRYVDLYVKHCGKPRAVIAYVYDPYIGATIQPGHRRRGGAYLRKQQEKVDLGKHVWLSVIENGELVSRKVKRPPMETSGWAKAIQGLQQVLKDKGIAPDALRLGVTSDSSPARDYVTFFTKIAPTVRWSAHTHGYARVDSRGKQWTDPSGAVINYAEYPDTSGSRQVYRNGGDPNRAFVVLNTVRDWHGDASGPAIYRLVPDAAFSVNQHRPSMGLARVGLDFWTLSDRALGKQVGRRNHGVFNRYWWNRSNRLYRSATYAVTAPGPDGALATLRYEMLREGMQEATTRWRLCEKLIHAPALKKHLGEQLARARKNYQRFKGDRNRAAAHKKIVEAIQARIETAEGHIGPAVSKQLYERFERMMKSRATAMQDGKGRGKGKLSPQADADWPALTEEFYTVAGAVLETSKAQPKPSR